MKNAICCYWDSKSHYTAFFTTQKSDEIKGCIDFNHFLILFF